MLCGRHYPSKLKSYQTVSGISNKTDWLKNYQKNFHTNCIPVIDTCQNALWVCGMCGVPCRKCCISVWGSTVRWQCIRASTTSAISSRWRMDTGFLYPHIHTSGTSSCSSVCSSCGLMEVIFEHQSKRNSYWLVFFMKTNVKMLKVTASAIPRESASIKEPLVCQVNHFTVWQESVSFRR